jgi:hypothetical protein
MKMQSLEERKLGWIVRLLGCMMLIKNGTDIIFHVIVVGAGHSRKVLAVSFSIR